MKNQDVTQLKLDTNQSQTQNQNLLMITRTNLFDSIVCYNLLVQKTKGYTYVLIVEREIGIRLTLMWESIKSFPIKTSSPWRPYISTVFPS